MTAKPAPNRSKPARNGSKPDVVDLVPNDKHTEEALIGALLLDADAMALVEKVLTPDDFHQEDLRAIYAAMCELYAARGGFDYQTVLNKVRTLDPTAYISPELMTYAPTLPRVEDYATTIHDLATKRRLLFGLSKAAELVYDPTLDAARVGAEALDIISTAATGNRPKATEDELRARWMEAHPLTLHSAATWRRYDPAAGVWERIEDGAVASEVYHVAAAAKSEGVNPTGRLLSSVTALARARCYVVSTVWDADPHLVICRNGVYNVETGDFREHRPDDYATAATAYDYDPDATAPAWDTAIARLRERDEEVADFLQEYLGYSLTTDTSHEIALWLYGPPGSGKSTIIEGGRAVLGPRAGNLSLRDIERSRFALSGIPGKTLLVSSENPADYVTTSDVLNALISGESINVERKNIDAFPIVPRAKLLWALNSFPRISDPNDGLYRRIKVVEFDPIPEGKRLPDLKEAISSEGSGILLWCLDGLRRLRRRGRFNIPASVTTATEAFKASNDVVSLFVSDRCRRGRDLEVGAQDLYNAYRTWCDDNGHKALASNRAAREWERLGCTRNRRPAGVFWQGLTLNAPTM